MQKIWNTLNAQINLSLNLGKSHLFFWRDLEKLINQLRDNYMVKNNFKTERDMEGLYRDKILPTFNIKQELIKHNNRDMRNSWHLLQDLLILYETGQDRQSFCTNGWKKHCTPKHDMLGFKTVGIGFNLDQPWAKKIFNKSFNHINFNSIYRGERPLNYFEQQALLNTELYAIIDEIKNKYGRDFWHNLPILLKFTMLIMGYHGFALIGTNTNFFKNIIGMPQGISKNYLKNIYNLKCELEFFSNRRKIKGFFYRNLCTSILIDPFWCCL